MAKMGNFIQFNVKLFFFVSSSPGKISLNNKMEHIFVINRVENKQNQQLILHKS